MRETYTHHADGRKKTFEERMASKFFKSNAKQPEFKPTSYAELEARKTGRKLAAEAKSLSKKRSWMNAG